MFPCRTCAVARAAISRGRVLMTSGSNDASADSSTCWAAWGRCSRARATPRSPISRAGLKKAARGRRELLSSAALAIAVSAASRAIRAARSLPARAWAYAGLRWGELVGLRVKRVDLLHQRITVAEQVTEIDGHFTWGPPKTEAGRRTVTLPAVAAAALAEHLATYSQPGPDGLVFTSTEGGLLRRSNFNRRVWRPATRAVGLEGFASTTCGTPRPPCPSPPGRAPGS